MHDSNYNLIIQYLKDQCSNFERTEVENWINQSAENKILFEEIKRIWEVEGEIPLDFTPDKEAAWKRIESGIRPNKKLVQQRIIAAVSIAAVVAVLIVGFYSTHKILSVKADTFFYASSQTYHADTIRRIELPDGSIAWLNEGSDFGIDSAFNKTDRKVYLKGEGYFEVARDTTKTFKVITDHTLTQVLGTSFNIKEKLGFTGIDVLTGKVAFSDSRNEKSVILLPGDHSDFNIKKEILEKSKSENANFLAWQTRKFEFKNKQLQVVCIELAKVYGFTFNIKSKELREKRITVGFDNQTVKEIFDVIAQTVNCEVIVNKNHITLK